MLNQDLKQSLRALVWDCRYNFIHPPQMDFPKLKLDDMETFEEQSSVVREAKVMNMFIFQSMGRWEKRNSSTENDDVVYVSSSRGFVDPEHPSHVYDSRKSLWALNKLHGRGYDKAICVSNQVRILQMAWSDSYTSSRGKKGKPSSTVQIYVDDIILPLQQSCNICI
ncbi:hypothetical protein Tco_0108692 [Tanacetum coccineum]